MDADKLAAARARRARGESPAKIAKALGVSRASIYRHLAADEQRTRQVIADVLAALSKDRNCLVLTNRTSHLEKFAGLLREAGHDPVILRGGMGAKSRAAALARLQPQPGGPAAPGRGHQPVRWRRLRLPGPGYLVPRRAGRQ